MAGEFSINNMNDVSNNQQAVYGLNNMNSTTVPSGYLAYN